MPDFTQQLEMRLLLRSEDTAARNAMSWFQQQAEDSNATPEQIWDLWEEKMGYIQKSYICSGRRVLLKYLAKRIRDKDWLEAHIGNLDRASLSVEDDPETIVCQLNTNHYRFGTDMESALQMTDDEVDVCCKLIRNLVCGEPNTRALVLIKDAFRVNKSKPWLTKAQAFRLGHLLGFTLDEMSFFLLRFFQDGVDQAHAENSNTFNLKKSDDLIEYFSFFIGDHHPEELKAAYQKQFGSNEKCGPLDPQAEDITEEISGYLLEEEPDWANPELSCEEKKSLFLEWLGENAMFLDVPSHSATELVRALVNTAAALYTGNGKVTTLISLPYVLDKVLKDQKQLSVVWDQEYCQKKAELIFEMMEVFSVNKRLDLETVHDLNEDPADLWRLDLNRNAFARLYSFVLPRANGTRDNEAGEAVRLEWQKAHNQHLQKLLEGTLAPMRGDVLLLVFLIAHMIWYDSSKPKTATLQQLSQFDTVARQLLDGKKYFSIGRYYIGHYSEFAFLSSIIFSSLNPKYTGLFWYTQLLARL